MSFLEKGPENARKSYKCKHCGNMFEAAGEASCPMCGYRCVPGDCLLLEASDEGY